MIKTLSIIAAFVLLFSACQTETPKQMETLPEEIIIPKVADSTDYAIIPFNKDDAWLVTTIFPKEMISTSLQASELEQINFSLQAFALNCKAEPEKMWAIYKNEHPEENRKMPDLTFNLADYKKQYMAVINNKGEKEVWVNCFCKNIEKQIEFTEWKSVPVHVSGGGICFFNMKLNLTKGNLYNFTINAESEKQQSK